MRFFEIEPLHQTCKSWISFRDDSISASSSNVFIRLLFELYADRLKIINNIITLMLTLCQGMVSRIFFRHLRRPIRNSRHLFYQRQVKSNRKGNTGQNIDALFSHRILLVIAGRFCCQHCFKD